MEIFKLIPAGKDYLWGGTKLKTAYGKNIPITPLAETWECSVHPDGLSIIANGSNKGKSLKDVLQEHPEYLGTKFAHNSELPILVKLIDAEQNLSVQVHPDDEYAMKHEDQNGKSEMWYIVDAADDASIVYGFEHAVTKEILQNAVKEGTLSKQLHKVAVKKGECYYIPAGTVHAIGAGCLIAEVQQSSNVTYRVYDYDRVDKNGQKRELYFDKAVEVMQMQPSQNVRRKPKLVKYFPLCSVQELCSCKYFSVERIEAQKNYEFTVFDESFQVVLCLDGSGIAVTGEDKHSFTKGDCLFVPASSGTCRFEGKFIVLKIRC